MASPVITRVRTRPRRLGVAEAPPTDVSAEFAEWVRGRLDGPVLRYSARQAMLKEAERRGLGRFDANLVIASVLYRAGMGQEYEMRPRVEWVAPVLVFLLLQGAILGGAWWVLW